MKKSETKEIVEQKNEVKDVTEVKEKKDVKKAEKKPKMFPRKKLPKLFKKQYTPETFEKKILKKLYIEEDKNYVKSLFKEELNKKGQKVLAIPQDTTVTKKERNRCEVLAKDINSQKFAIKVVPLCAVVVLCAVVGITVALFKNTFVKWAVTSSMEGIFRAECDLSDVDFRIFGAKLELKGLEQTNKDKPSTNLFSIDDIDIDFDLTELLRGKFVIDNIQVTGVAIDSERNFEGKVYEEPSDIEEAQASLQEKMNDLLVACGDQLKELFGDYDPEKMLKDFQDELQTPKKAEQIAGEVKEKVEKWSKKPEEMKAQITDYSASVDSIVKSLQKGTSTEIVKAVQEGQALKEKGMNLQASFKAIADDVKADSKAVKTYSTELQEAVKADQKLCETKINEIKKTFSKEGLQKIMNDAVESMLYKYCGDYYPYVSELLDMAMDAMQSSSGSAGDGEEAKEIAKPETEPAKRFEGRDVYFKKDTVPKILVKKLEASGKQYKGDENLFHGEAVDFSSDMDQWGKPAVIRTDFKVGSDGQYSNDATITIDARHSSKAPLVAADYIGKGYPVNFNAQVFDLSSNAEIKAALTASANGNWSVSGSLGMNVSEMKGMEFQPERVCRLYNNALSKVRRLDIGFTISFDKKSGIIVKIDNPEKLGGQLADPVIKAVNEELSAIAQDASAKLAQMISDKTGIATEEIEKYTKLEGDVTTYQDQLTNKFNELTKELAKQGTNQATKAAEEGVSKLLGNSEAGKKAGEKTGNLLNKISGSILKN